MGAAWPAREPFLCFRISEKVVRRERLLMCCGRHAAVNWRAQIFDLQAHERSKTLDAAAIAKIRPLPRKIRVAVCVMA